MKPYTMVIQWSERDQIYVVSLPEWGDLAKTHGATYEEAARMGAEVLDLLIETARAQGQPLPAPHTHGDAARPVSA